MNFTRRFALPLLFTLACAAPILVSCGGSQPPAEAPPSASASASSDTPAATPAPETSAAPSASASSAPAAASAAPSASAAIAWKDMNHDARMDYMKKVVLPKMKDEFVAFDSKHFADMNCKTCHGDGVKDGSFKMPNAKLPKLSVEGGFKKHMAKTPEMTKFMMNKVEIDMAALLGEAPYDMKTQKGFGCFDCHTMQK